MVEACGGGVQGAAAEVLVINDPCRWIVEMHMSNIDIDIDIVSLAFVFYVVFNLYSIHCAGFQFTPKSVHYSY
jgi:hypothetical protein